MMDEESVPNEEFTGGDEPTVPAVIGLRSGKIMPSFPKKKGVVEGANPPEKNGVSFFRIYTKNLVALLDERETVDGKDEPQRTYSFADFGLLCALMAFAEWGTNKLIVSLTKRYMTISDLAVRLGVTRKHMTNSLAWMEEKGFVKTLPQEDGSKFVMVNAQLMWFGKEMQNLNEQFHAFNRVHPPTGEYIPVYKPKCPVVYKERNKKGEKKSAKKT